MAVDELVLIPSGEVHFAGMNEPIVVDEKSARDVLKAFKAQGVDLPVDYEHATTEDGDNARRAPAVGFISKLRYEKNRGIVGAVDWVNTQARDDVETGAYRYLSPVFVYDTGTMAIKRITSVGLTNRPATKGMKAILEAKDSIGKNEAVAVCSDLGYMDDPATKQANVFQSLSFAVNSLRELCRTVGVEFAEDATPIDVIDAAREILDKAISATADIEPENTDMPNDETKVTAKEPADAIRKVAAALGLPETADEAMVIAKAGEYATRPPIPDDYEVLKTTVATMRAKEGERTAKEAVARFVGTKLNPRDEKRMAWATKVASENTEAFVTLMEGAPDLAPLGQVFDASSAAPKDDRATIIASAKAEHSEQGKRAMSTAKGFINEALREKDMPELTAKEIEAL